MRLFDSLKGKAAIRGTADHFGETPEDVRREIQAAILHERVPKLTPSFSVFCPGGGPPGLHFSPAAAGEKCL